MVGSFDISRLLGQPVDYTVGRVWGVKSSGYTGSFSELVVAENVHIVIYELAIYLGRGLPFSGSPF